MKPGNNLLKALGPGLLFAGAAIGVSHLVQSTRAGAVYGLALIGFIILANIVKYPAFLIGNQYAAVSGENLLVSYKRQGPLAIWSFVVATLLTMFAGCASISLTTAALVKINFDLPYDTMTIILGVWGVVGAVLFFGQYRALDWLIKILLSFLTLATLAATLLIIPRLPFDGFQSFMVSNYDRATILFIAALAGWMPAPLDTSVWQSLWSQARARVTGYAPTRGEATTDFNIGFVATTILAICFVLMGAGVMYDTGVSFETSAVGFAGQIVSLYEQTLGEAVARVVGFAALAVIFSTTLTAIDAWPRTLAAVALSLQGEEEAGKAAHAIRHPYYWIGMAILLVGSYVIISLMMNSFKVLIDVATTVSFVMAPVFAYLNHKAMFAGIVEKENRPGGLIYLWSIAGVLILAVFAISYLWFRFLS